MTFFKATFALLLVVFVSSYFFLQKAFAVSTQTTVSKPALVVSTTKPQWAIWQKTLPANGNVAAWQEAIIGSEVSGLRLSAVHVDVGDVVRKGQVLAQFSQDSLQQAVSEQNALLAEAQAVLTEAQANAQRAKLLQKSGALPAQQIDQLLISEKTARAKTAAAKARLASAQLQLSFTQVLAPDDGIIASRNATLGAVVGSGEELFRLIRKGRLEWRAEVSPSDLALLTTKTAVDVILPNQQHIQGTVRTIAPTVDMKTRDALVYVDLPHASTLKAGLFLKGEFLLKQVNVLTVPHQAIVVRDGFNYVFTVSNAHVTQHKVQLGEHQQERVEIVEGLDANADIVVNGAGFLNDGDLISVQN